MFLIEQIHLDWLVSFAQEHCVKKDPEATSWVHQKVHCDQLAMSALGKETKKDDMKKVKYFTHMSFIFNFVTAN